jgi:hypothetical protein
LLLQKRLLLLLKRLLLLQKRLHPLKRLRLLKRLLLLLRKKRGYRVIDHLFTLHLIGYLFRLFKPRDPKAMPKFLRKSAMGIDSLFR